MGVEKQADNIVTTEEKVEQPTSPVENAVDPTKAYSERLKKDRAAIEKEVAQKTREEIAKSYGYESFDAYNKAQQDNKILDKGLDPELVRPIVNELIEKDPKIIQARELLARQEELDKALYAQNALVALNNKFGTNFTSINDLDPDTVAMWNAGTPLEKAYAANNYEQIKENAVKQVKIQASGKDHLKTVETGNVQSNVKKLTQTEIDLIKKMNRDITDAEIEARMNRTDK